MGKQAQKPTEEIIEEIRRGLDVEANYKRLFDRYCQQVYRFYSKRGLSPEDSRDLVQEAFISAFRGLDELRETKKFQRWLFRIARNVHVNHLEQKQAQKRVARELSLDMVESAPSGEDDQGLQVAKPIADPLNTILAEEKRSELRDAVGNLPAQMRRCVQMRIMKGMSNAEIADAMGISVNTVKAHLQQAKKILKEKLLRHLMVMI